MAGLLPKILDTNDDPTPPIYRNEQRDESSSKLSASEVDDQESEKEES